MTDKNLYNAYQKASHTVDEIKQVIMLYEGAINFIHQAKDAILEKDYEKRYNLINKAISIITGLNSCLEFNEGTEGVSNALDQYYQSLDIKLLYIQCDNSMESCDEVIHDLKVMLDTWKEVDRQISDAKKSPSTAAQAAKEEESSNPIADNTANSNQALSVEISI